VGRIRQKGGLKEREITPSWVHSTQLKDGVGGLPTHQETVSVRGANAAALDGEKGNGKSVIAIIGGKIEGNAPYGNGGE